MASRIDVSHSTAVKFKVVVSVLLVSHCTRRRGVEAVSTGRAPCPGPHARFAGTCALVWRSHLSPQPPIHPTARAGFACVFAMVATLHANPLDTYWTTRGFCDYSIALDTTVDMSRGIVEVCELNVFDWYMACFTWAMLVVTGYASSHDDSAAARRALVEPRFACVPRARVPAAGAVAPTSSPHLHPRPRISS